MPVDIIQNKDLQNNNQQTQNFNPFSASTQKNKQKGTGFTNIGKIVQASQGNKLGSTISGGIQGAAQQAQQGIQQAGQQFQQQAQANDLSSAANQSKVQTILADPTKAGAQDIQAFQGYASGAYKGPTQLENQEKLQAQTQQAQQLGQAATTAEGRQSLLQRFAGKPSYSYGQQRLDNLLLGATGDKQINQAARATQGIEGQLQQQQEAASAQAQEYTNRAKAFGEDVQSQFLNKLQGIDKTIADKAAANQEAYNQTLKNLQAGKMSAADAAALGVGADTNLYNVDLSKFLTQNVDALSKGNVASADQLANINALKNLAGNTITKAGGVFDEYQGAKGGLDAAAAYSLDKDRLQKDIANKKYEYDTAVAPQQQTLTKANTALQGDPNAKTPIEQLGLEKSFNMADDIIRRLNARQEVSDSELQILERLTGVPVYHNGATFKTARGWLPDLQAANHQLYTALQSAQQQKSASQAALEQLSGVYNPNKKLTIV